MKDGINEMLCQHFAGKVVRKDLTNQVKEGANVPTYVLEYLLGMYCATDDEDSVRDGMERVKNILAENFVRPDEAEKIKAKIREAGTYTVIDKVEARLDPDHDNYKCVFSNLNIKNVIVDDSYIKKYEKLLVGGIWCILRLTYNRLEERDDATYNPIGFNMEHWFRWWKIIIIFVSWAQGGRESLMFIRRYRPMQFSFQVVKPRLQIFFII